MRRGRIAEKIREKEREEKPNLLFIDLILSITMRLKLCFD
jgi:hypothetical protein